MRYAAPQAVPKGKAEAKMFPAAAALIFGMPRLSRQHTPTWVSADVTGPFAPA